VKVGLIVTIIYVALEGASRYFTGHAASFNAVGVGPAPLDLLTGALDEASAGIAAISMTIGLALPSLRGKPVVDQVD